MSYITRSGVVACIACVALGLLISACGSSGGGSSQTSSSSTSTESTGSSTSSSDIYAAAKQTVEKLSAIQPTPQLPALSGPAPSGKTVAGVNCTLPTCVPDAGKEQAKMLGWEFKSIPIDLTKGPSDAVRALDQAIAAKPDYIYFKSLYSMEPLAPGLAKANAAGIPVVQYAGTSGAENVVGCVNCDPEYVEVGKVMTQVALADAGAKTGIAFVCDQNYTPLQQLNQGFDDMAAEGKSSGTAFDKVNVDLTKPPAEVAQTVVNFVKRQPDTQYVLACVPEVATALPQALAQAGLTEKIKVIYGSPHPQQLAAVKAGTAFAAVASEAEFSSWRGFDLMVRLGLEDEIPEDLRNPVGWMQIINKENAGQVDPTMQPPNTVETFAELWQRN